MPPLRERLPDALAIQRESLELHRSRIGDTVHDNSGSLTNMCASAARFVGVAEFVLNGDATSFCEGLTESVTLVLSLFDRAQTSDSISASYL